MTERFVTNIGGHAKVGAVIGKSNAAVSVSMNESTDPDRQQLVAALEQLRMAIAEAHAAGQLTAEQATIAEYELENTASEVDGAFSGKKAGLLATLQRLMKLLERARPAIDLAAQVAAVITMVQGFR
jgi:hypothetical protein